MTQFRKKPIEVEAYQFDNRITNRVPYWLSRARADGLVSVQTHPTLKMTIKTLEGEMTASEGDWIIKGVKGELYPCKPDIFEQTYERVAA